jgi:hypothetical protein
LFTLRQCCVPVEINTNAHNGWNQMKSLAAIALILALAACSPPTEAEIAEAGRRIEAQEYVDATRDAERRLDRAKKLDLDKSIFVVPGAPLCPDKREIEAVIGGAPNRCLEAPASVEAHFMGSGIVAMTIMAYQVRIPFKDGTGFGEFWIPEGGVVNDVAELALAATALSAARMAERAALAPTPAPSAAIEATAPTP